VLLLLFTTPRVKGDDGLFQQQQARGQKKHVHISTKFIFNGVHYRLSCYHTHTPCVRDKTKIYFQAI